MTDQKIHIEIIKKFSPEKEIKTCYRFVLLCNELKPAALRKDYPELNEKDIQKKVTEIFLYAKS